MCELLRVKYQNTSDDDLVELASAPEANFNADAWRALQDEVAARGLARSGSGASGTQVASGAADPSTLVGLRGWLAVFMAYAILVAGSFALGFTIVGGHVLSIGGLFVNGFLVLTAIGIALIVYRKPIAPTFWTLMEVAQVAFIIVLAIAGVFSGLRLVGQLVWPIAWIIYWQNSRRVRATFSAASSNAGAGAAEGGPLSGGEAQHP
jgi:hypothetical protein